MPEGEAPLDLTVRTSVEHAFSSESSSDVVQARNKIERGSRGLREKLLGLVKNVAHSARERGFLTELTGEVEKRMASSIWETAQERVRKRVSGEAVGNMQWVMATLNELDPMDVEVRNVSAKPGEPQTRKVRRSVGLPSNAEINYRQVRSESPLPDNQQDVSQIVLAGFSFRKAMVLKALKGEGPFKPMWRRDGVDLFLYQSQSGELYDISMSWNQAKRILAKSEVQERGFVDKEQLKEMFEGLTEEPVSQFEKARAKNGLSGRRSIITPSGLFFQGRTYGKEHSVSDEQLHRVYFQVEIEDIPRMVEILKEIGATRAQKGEGLDYKFLVGTSQEADFHDFNCGEYSGIKDKDPRVVAYFDSSQQQREFIRGLFGNPHYQEDLRRMSEKRKNPDGSWKARRPGSHVWYDSQTGGELRAINYTEGGYSEDVLKRYGEENWRNFVRGMPTGKIYYE